MPNESYQRRLEEWQKKERERKAAMEPPPSYDPTKLRSRIPWGCAIIILTGLAFFGYAVYRYFKLHA